MMTQSVMSQVSNLFSNAKLATLSTEKKTSISNDFSNVMDNNMKSKDSKLEQSSTKNKSMDDENLTRVDSEKSEKIVNHSSTNAETTLAKESIKDQDSVDSTLTDADKAKSLQEKIDKLTEKVQTTVLSTLDISKEELEKILETLGLTMLDLLNVDNLKLLAVQVNGSADITAALTDESLANTVQKLMQAFEDLQLESTSQLTEEELATLANKGSNAGVVQNAETTVTQNAIQNGNTEQNPNVLNEKHMNSENQNVDTDASDQKDITIEVQKMTSDESSSNATDSNSSNEQDVDTTSQVTNFINNLVVGNNEQSATFAEQIANVRQMQEITNQIVEQIKIVIKPEQTSMELQLNPGNLGKINLSVVAKDGVLTAQFVAQNEIAKEAIESQMHVLRENLNNQGLKVESIEVTVSNFGFEQSNEAATGQEQQSNSQRRSMFKEDSDLSVNLTEEEVLAADIMEQNGNSIDYSA